MVIFSILLPGLEYNKKDLTNKTIAVIIIITKKKEGIRYG